MRLNSVRTSTVFHLDCRHCGDRLNFALQGRVSTYPDTVLKCPYCGAHNRVHDDFGLPAEVPDLPRELRY
jgi:hypothetical protein